MIFEDTMKSVIRPEKGIRQKNSLFTIYFHLREAATLFPVWIRKEENNSRVVTICSLLNNNGSISDITFLSHTQKDSSAAR